MAASSCTDLKLVNVVNALQNLTLDQTKNLALQLGVQLSVLIDIENEQRGETRKAHYVQAWLDIDTEANWEKIIAALKQIRLDAIAAHVTSQYLPKAQESISDGQSFHLTPLSVPVDVPVTLTQDITSDPTPPPVQAPQSGVSIAATATPPDKVEHLRAQVQQLEQQLQSQRVLTEVHVKTREILQLWSTVQEKERELEEKDHAIQTSEQLVAQFQQTLMEKDRIIGELQQTTSAQSQPASGKMGKTVTATVPQKDVSKLRWKYEKKAPHTMRRGSAVVDGNTVYIIPAGSLKIYSCQITSQDLQWSTLPETKYNNPSLAVIDGILTTVGGEQYLKWTNSLLSLNERGGRRRWSKIFPAMPTPRNQTVSVTTQLTLIVAGGCAENKNLDIVEVMDIPTKQWTTASHLPYPFGGISGTICGDQLYLAGGYVGFGELTKSVLTCSVTDLLSPPSLAAGLRTLSLAHKTGVWRHA